jgi:hypothetical protein
VPKIFDAQYVTDVNGTGYIIGYQDGVFCRWPVTMAVANKWLSGDDEPNAGTGNNDDFYLNATTGDVYQKEDGAWSVIANIKGNPGTNGADGTNGTNGIDGVSPKEIYYSASGNLQAQTGKLKRYISAAHTVSSIKVLLGTASSGAAIMFDVRKNGVSHSILGADATIPEGETSLTVTTFNDAALSLGDYLTVDVTQVGSTATGSDLSLVIILV